MRIFSFVLVVAVLRLTGRLVRGALDLALLVFAGACRLLGRGLGRSVGLLRRRWPHPAIR